MIALFSGFCRRRKGAPDALPDESVGAGSSARIPVWKRALDILLVLLALPLVLPVGLVIAGMIRAVSPGPVLFRQERVGFVRRRFMCFKFRTMTVHSSSADHESHLSRLMTSNAPMAKLDSHGDARIIRYGQLWRSSGLDELPQLINVLRGEMSLVGPRPCLPYECENYLPWQMERFNTLPGLTGQWQVGGKNRTTFVEMMQMDIYYCRKRSPWRDLAIIMKTPFVILGQVREMLAHRRRRFSSPAGARLESSLNQRSRQ